LFLALPVLRDEIGRLRLVRFEWFEGIVRTDELPGCAGPAAYESVRVLSHVSGGIVLEQSAARVVYNIECVVARVGICWPFASG
jgi:hypothetical protein